MLLAGGAGYLKNMVYVWPVKIIVLFLTRKIIKKGEGRTCLFVFLVMTACRRNLSNAFFLHVSSGSNLAYLQQTCK